MTPPPTTTTTTTTWTPQRQYNPVFTLRTILFFSQAMTTWVFLVRHWSVMHTYDVTAWGRTLAVRTQDVIGCRYSNRVQWVRFSPEAGTAEQVTAGETVDGWCRFRVNGDRTGTSRARRLLTWQTNAMEKLIISQWIYIDLALDIRNSEHIPALLHSCNVLHRGLKSV